jgi:hypothetical protein
MASHPTQSHATRFSWILIPGIVVLVLLLLGLHYLIEGDRVGDDYQGQASVQDVKVVVGIASETPQPSPTSRPLVAAHNFKAGDVLELISTSAQFCTVGEHSRIDQDHLICEATVRAFAGDVVEITGEGFCVEVDGCFWPVIGRKGGVYVKDQPAYITDNAAYLRGGITPNEPPDWVVGDMVATNFNFLVRRAPAGDPILGNYGWPIVFGGSLTIVAGPIETAGHYWCGFQDPELTQQQETLPVNFVFWVPCEFQPVTEEE